ncbi:two pore domain potassium channel family protein [Pedobacter sp. HMF7647]|uniref:Two pore domain potassium channel family protein n=1 Tax=Hufsiella arboris TaxID=2695275 RepID=A0A7K1Y5R2_9SPHI|nr:potassium channel family protein [Hufsiella arboris]MXV49770.1 two pore domain potassium channel family protein [Hufsiella arboris]
MYHRLRKLFFGKVSPADNHAVNILGGNLKKVRKVWDGNDYDDFGIERIFRLFLITARFLFPGIYLSHVSGRVSIVLKKLTDEIYVVLKAVLPLVILHFNLESLISFQVINVYFLLETFIIIFNRIFVSEHYSSNGYRRSLLLLFINFLEVIFSFAVLYRSGNYFNETLNNMDAVYFSLMTGVTIGYGDIHPVTTIGKILTMSQGITSLSFLVLFFNFFNSKIKEEDESEIKSILKK